MNRIACVMAMALVAAPAAGQDATPPGAGLNRNALSTVFVVDDRGAETTGKLLRFDNESIVILVNGQERQFELGGVRKIEKRGDSLKNGAIIGAVVGLVFGALTGGMADCKQSDGSFGECGAGTRAGMALVSAGIYGAIGAGIDAAIPGRTTLYQKPAISGGLPASGPGASLGFSVRW
ncbi:MAG: hypothetical protein IMZ75_09985 [Actinobacteria bacterium]|nr:hypothetical protein [Actinomycetota bacterium]